MICPKCKKEYDKKIIKCPACESKLIKKIIDNAAKSKKSNQLTNYRIIFQTGRSYEILMASNKLKEAKIPFITRQESASGLSLAMLPTPVMGPGIFFSIRVPESMVDDAIKILEELPIDLKTEPDVWHFGPSEGVKNFWKFYAKISIIGFIIALVIVVLGLILNGR